MLGDMGEDEEVCGSPAGRPTPTFYPRVLLRSEG